MGKKTRNKNKRGAKTNNKNKTSVVPDNNNNNNCNNTVLQRLRHSDSRTRHAALVALNMSILNPQDLIDNKRKISSDLLQAIRERVMDPDLECAIAAAGCLSNYLLFSQTQVEQMTAGWTLVLLQRLDQCLLTFQEIKTATTTPKGRPIKQKKHWIVLAVNCLHALCGVIETNPLTLDRIRSRQQFKDPLSTIFGLLQFGAAELEQHHQQQTTPSSLPLALDSSTKEHIEDLMIYASRALHSALDDNEDLMGTINRDAWNLIQTTSHSPNVPIMSRLHSAGCLVSAARLASSITNESNNNNTNSYHHHHNIIQSTVLPLLHANISLSDNGSFATLLEGYVSAYNKFKAEEDDQKMERDIIKKVNARKEPARLIARRQKALREQKKEQEKQTTMMTGDIQVATMKGGDNDNDGMAEDAEMKTEKEGEENQESKPSEPENAEQILDDARNAWFKIISPLELALEVTANLTNFTQQSSESMDLDGMDDNGDDIQWTQEQEDKVREQYGGGQAEQTLSKQDANLVEILVKARLPFQLVELLKRFSVQLPQNAPLEVHDTLEELQSSCGGCIANCLTFPHNWTDGLLHELQQILKLDPNNSAVARVMVATLRGEHREGGHQINPQDLNFVLQLAATKGCQKEGIEMLGVLCSEPHPIEINKAVCEALIKTESKRASIVNEVLNALMDIYGEDENHPEVFESMKVLQYFQTKLPEFKRLIKCDKDDSSPEDVEEWRETALNSSRFIRYKKGQL